MVLLVKSFLVHLKAATSLLAVTQPFSLQDEIIFKVKFRVSVMSQWQESAVCYNTTHNSAAHVRSIHFAPGHTNISIMSTHRQLVQMHWGVGIGLLQTFYSLVPTRQCPPTDEVSEQAASHTMAFQRIRISLLTRLFVFWQPVAVCLGAKLGVEDLNWKMCIRC